MSERNFVIEFDYIVDLDTQQAIHTSRFDIKENGEVWSKDVWMTKPETPDNWDDTYLVPGVKLNVETRRVSVMLPQREMLMHSATIQDMIGDMGGSDLPDDFHLDVGSQVTHPRTIEKVREWLFTYHEKDRKPVNKAGRTNEEDYEKYFPKKFPGPDDFPTVHSVVRTTEWLTEFFKDFTWDEYFSLGCFAQHFNIFFLSHECAEFWSNHLDGLNDHRSPPVAADAAERDNHRRHRRWRSGPGL